jgi:hypothetical protein
MNNLKSWEGYTSLNESTTLNALDLSQSLVQAIMKNRDIKSHKAEYLPVANKTEVKNELRSGVSTVIARKDADDVIVIKERDVWGRKKSYSVTVWKNGERDYKGNFSMTQAMAFVTKDYSKMWVVKGDYHKGGFKPGRYDADVEVWPENVTGSDWVRNWIIQKIEAQKGELVELAKDWIGSYRTSSRSDLGRFEHETPEGVTNWGSDVLWRIGFMNDVIDSLRKDGSLVQKIINKFGNPDAIDSLEGEYWEDAALVKNAVRKALAPIPKNLHWVYFVKGNNYGGLFGKDLGEMKEDDE